MRIERIENGSRVCAVRIPAGAWAEGLTFYTDDADFIQVGTWVYEAGRRLGAHYHNVVPRRIDRTQEVVHVRRGSVRATICDLDGTLLGTLLARAGDTLILLDGAHGYEVLEDGTEVLEVKNGPYPGPDADRTRL